MSNASVDVTRDAAPVAPTLSAFVEREQCPACGGRQADTIYECAFTDSPICDYLCWFYEPQGYIELERLENGVYRLNRCKDCELVYQHQILNDEMMQVLYDDWIDPKFSYDFSANASADHYSQYAVEINQLVNYFNRQPNTIKVFDFGMGWAQWIRMAAGFGCEVYGAELSVARIAHAERYGITVVSWDEMPDHQFEVINTEQVFEHIPEPLETLLHLKQCLSRDGLLKISVPNGAGIEAKLKATPWRAEQSVSEALNPVAPLEHINCFKHRSLEVLADRAGMEVVTMPLRSQLFGYINLSRPKASLKSLIKPIYRRLRPSTYVFLRHKR